MRRRATVQCLLVPILLLLCQCDNETTTAALPVSGRDRGVRHANVTAAPFQPRQSVIGQVVSRRELTLRAAAAGRVADCPWQVGQTVSKGQVLCRLTGPRIERSRQLLSDHIQMLLEQKAKLQADVDRLAQLQTKRYVSENDKNLLTDQAALRESELAITQARNELQHLEAAGTLLAPVDGTIITLHVREGSDVAENEAVANLSVPSDVAIELAFFPLHGLHLHLGTLADVYLDPSTDSPSLLRVDYLLPTTDPRSGAYVAGILVGDRDHGVTVGQRLKVDLLGDEVSTVLVPDSAVVARAGKTFCVSHTQEGWKPVEVTVVGSDDAGRLHVTGNLRPGDEIVSEGAYGLIYSDFRELFTFED